MEIGSDFRAALELGVWVLEFCFWILDFGYPVTKALKWLL